MSANPPTYEELSQTVVDMQTQLTRLTKQVKAKDAHGLVPSNVKVEQPAYFTGTHNGTDVKNFTSACNAYFELVGISDDNTRARCAQLRLTGTARTWFDGQGYDLQTITWTLLQAELLAYFVPIDQARRARRQLMQTKQGKRHVQAYIDDFRKALLECTDVAEAEAKFVFESNLADWLAALVLPHQCGTLRDTVLCAQSIGSIERVRYTPQTPPPMQQHASKPNTQQHTQYHDPEPMQLGKFQGKFQGKCFRCGKNGHKKAQCRVHPQNFAKNNSAMHAAQSNAARSANPNKNLAKNKGKMHYMQSSEQENANLNSNALQNSHNSLAQDADGACSSSQQSSVSPAASCPFAADAAAFQAHAHAEQPPEPPAMPHESPSEISQHLPAKKHVKWANQHGKNLKTQTLYNKSAVHQLVRCSDDLPVRATASEPVVVPVAPQPAVIASPPIAANKVVNQPCHQLLEIHTSVNKIPTSCLIDSGASHCFISSSLVSEAALPIIKGEELTVTLADGSEFHSEQCTVVPLELDGQVSIGVDCRIVDNLTSPIVLGINWLTQYNPCIDWSTFTVELETSTATVTLTGMPAGPNNHVELCSAKAMVKELNNGAVAWFAMLKQFINTESTANTCTPSGRLHGAYDPSNSSLVTTERDAVARDMERICEQYASVFDLPGKPVPRAIKHRIDLLDETEQPPRPRLYRMSQDELDEIKKQLAEYLEKGWIRPSSSPYGSPVLFARKKDGSLRMCVDYRQLNKQTRIDSYPLPRIDEILDRLSKARYFSKIDLAQGYHQIQIEEGHEFKTAFTCRYGTYEFLVMPFGLTNAPSTFQRLMNTTFHDLLDTCVTVYLDDILIYSATAEEHSRHIAEVLSRLQNAKLYAKRKKCSFGQTEVEYLGHVISAGQVHMDPTKTVAISQWPQPSSVKELQQFLGLANYYARFIPYFAEMASPLSALLRKERSFLWGPDQDQAFVALKNALTAQPVLRLADFDRQFHLETDASDVAIGAVLSQEHDGHLLPVCYYSKKLSDAERRYPVQDRELLAIKEALTKWRCYCMGRITVVHSDHEPLKYFQSQPHLNDRQLRWLDTLAQYPIKFQYRPGKDNVVPDALSRIPSANRSDVDRVEAIRPHIVTDQQYLLPHLAQLLGSSYLFDCVSAALQSLAAGFLLAAFACPKCGTEHLDSHSFATKRHIIHVCSCGHKWRVSPAKIGNPLARWSPVLVDNQLRFTILDNLPVSPTTGSLSSLIVEPSWLARVYAGQQSDSELAAYFQKARSSGDDFRILTKFGFDLLYRTPKPNISQLVIPNSAGLRQLLVEELHSTYYSAHLGVRKTLSALQQRVWWPNMVSFVKTYVAGCDTCQRVKHPTRPPYGTLSPLPIPTHRFDFWTLDFVTDLPLDSGCNCLFVCVEKLTKFTKLIPCSTGEGALSAQDVARLFFTHIVRHFGVPKMVLSDRDPRFTAVFWESLWSILGSKVLLSSAFHPQTDGQTERANQTIQQLLRTFVSINQHWVDKVPYVEFAINSAVSDSTGKSPFELCYGQPVASIIDHLDGMHRCAAAQDLITHTQQLVSEAQSALHKAQKQQAKYYDAKRIPMQFSVGDNVLLSTQNLHLAGNRKFKPRFIGPYKITQCIGSQAYRLQLPASLPVHNVFHVGLLKPYVPGGDGQATPVPVQLADSNGDLEYEIEAILRSRPTRGNKARQFLVQWKGYGPEHNMWLDENEFGNAQDILNEFLARKNAN